MSLLISDSNSFPIFAFMWTIINYLKNAWRFRKELTNFVTFDASYSLPLLRRGIELNLEGMFGGQENLTDFNQKRKQKMERAVEILRTMEGDSWYEVVEKEKGITWDHQKESCIDVQENGMVEIKITKHDAKVISESIKIEDKWTKELWEILKGQEIDDAKSWKHYDKKYDGSGIFTWWL